MRLRMKDSAFLCAIAISLAFSVAASAGTVTYLFTTTGSGTIGADSFTDALATVTAVGDTSSIFIWQPGIYVVVPTQFSINIAGVGTASFTGAGVFGGSGYVFDNQGSSAAGFGTSSDRDDISDLAFASYALATALGPISGSYMHFSGDPTSLGLLDFTPTAFGTFTAVTTPEPGSLLLHASGAVGAVGLLRRKFAL